jgi:glycosyltransferase involved in cell wall biosynthesis
MTATGPRRILMLNTEHGWRGGENQVLLLAKGLAGDAIEPITVCQPGSPLAAATAAAGLPVVPLAMRGQWHLGAIRALRRLMRERDVSVVHAHTSHAHSLGALACRGTGVPLVVTRRVDFPLKRGLIARWKYRSAVLRHAAVSDAVRRVLVAGGVDPQRVEVIHDGIDFARFPQVPSTLRSELAIPEEAVVVGVTAHLSDHKDHRTLLTAFAAVERAAPEAWLLVVGTGELEGGLKALAAQLGLQRTVFTGFRADIGNVLRGLDVFTLTSHLEGLGSSLMDAMYCGLPVVATRAGGMPELIDDGVDGLLVGVRDHAAVADALLRLVRDGGLRRRLGDAARRRAEERFSAAAMVARYRALYERLPPAR